MKKLPILLVALLICHGMYAMETEPRSETELETVKSIREILREEPAIDRQGGTVNSPIQEIIERPGETVLIMARLEQLEKTLGRMDNARRSIYARSFSTIQIAGSISSMLGVALYLLLQVIKP